MTEQFFLYGREVFDHEIETLRHICDSLDDTFDAIVREMMDCTGKIILIGMGKSGHIANKVAATLSSLGTCAIALNPAECMHGDLGMIQSKDLVILISFSGESDEIIKIIPGIKHIGAKMIGMTGNPSSTLARSVKIVQCFTGIREAGPLGLAPTASSTAVLVYGDALAVTIARLKNFGRTDFSLFHPAGSLGKMLTTRTADLMHPLNPACILPENATIRDALTAMLDSVSDLLPIVNTDGCLIGILTNGDLKKLIHNPDLASLPILPHIHRYPYFIDVSTLAVDALRLMQDNHVHVIPVVRNDQPIGMINQADILNFGIFCSPSR